LQQLLRELLVAHHSEMLAGWLLKLRRPSAGVVVIASCIDLSLAGRH